MIRLACVIGMLASPVTAQTMRCGDHGKMVSYLAEKYGEGKVAIGLAANGAVLETFASAETGSWTMLMTSPQGLTCFLASGESYEAVSETLEAPDY